MAQKIKGKINNNHHTERKKLELLTIPAIFTIWRFRLRIRLFSKVESAPVVEPAPVLESAPKVEWARENEHFFTQ